MKRFAYFATVLMTAAAWLYASWPTLLTLHPKWSDVGDSYVLGYPLMAAAMWLIYQRRERLCAKSPAPSWWGVLLFAASMAIVYAARLIQLQIAQQIMLPISLWCMVLAVAGWHAARATILPIALQYFGMPVWDPLIGVLQSMTVFVAQTSLGWMQIPAWFQANHIHLPDGIVTVADSCSGLNLLLAMMLIATLQGQMGCYDTRRRIRLLLVAGIIGLLDNWIRVVALILIAHYTHMQHPIVYDHASFGWWIYAASLIPFFLIARRLETTPAPQLITHAVHLPSSSQLPLKQVVAIISMICAGELLVASLTTRVGHVREMAMSGETRSLESGFTPNYSGYDLRQTWQIENAGNQFELTTLVYTRQAERKKLIYYGNVIASENELQSTGQVHTPQGRTLNFAVVNGSQRRVVWWFYWVDGTTTVSPLRAKIYQLKASILGDPSAALIALSQTCETVSCTANLQKMERGVYKDVVEQMLSIQGLR